MTVSSGNVLNRLSKWVNGQWICIDRNHNVAIGKFGSMPVSKDMYLDSYNVEGFYGIVKYLSK